MTRDEHERAMGLLRRSPVLEACRTEATVRPDLVEETGTSRTTVYRTTVDFEDRDLLEKTDDGYRTTSQGEALSHLVDTFLAGIEAIDRLEPLLEAVPDGELLEHAHLLHDATVTTVDASDPYRVAERSIERFERARDVRGVVASASSRDMLEDAAAVVESKRSVEWYFAESALDVHDAVGGETLRDALDAPHVTVGVAPDDAVPFTFSVDQDDVSISGHDPTSGLPTVVVESESEAARRWLEARFETIREAATPLDSWLESQ